MKKLIVAGAFLASLTTFSQCANAASITYLINRVIPQQSTGYGNAEVTGYITTNGTLGLISVSDIISFDIQTTVVGRLETRQSERLTNSNAFLSSFATTSLEATASTLFIDMAPGSPRFNIRDTFAGVTNSAWSLVFNPNGRLDETIAARGFVSSDQSNAQAGFIYSKAELGTTSGRLTQGALAVSTSVPLPSSALLIVMGLGALYKRSRKTN
jgi:hypothetical protein